MNVWGFIMNKSFSVFVAVALSGFLLTFAGCASRSATNTTNIKDTLAGVQTLSINPLAPNRASIVGHNMFGTPISAVPSRAFAGPSEYPPSGFSAYGVVVFTSKAVAANFGRYKMICEAYTAAMPSFLELGSPVSGQFVTVWPITTDDISDSLNSDWPFLFEPAEFSKLCRKAVGAYNLAAALRTLDAARRSGAALDGVGPFLLAWSPPTKMGMPKAPVLVMDLSNVTSYSEAQRLFLDWRRQIVEKPKLWRDGWDIEKIRIKILLFADRYGSKIMRLFGE